jgi:hypothetical protein
VRKPLILKGQKNALLHVSERVRKSIKEKELSP